MSARFLFKPGYTLSTTSIFTGSLSVVLAVLWWLCGLIRGGCVERIDETGWLMGVRKLVSPNFNQRPSGVSVSLLVIHNISLPPGEFNTGCVEAFFCNQLDPRQHPYFAIIAELQVSAHFFIARDGELVQFVSVYDRAWHAGASSFAGVENCNDYSIGVELEGADDIPYTDAQYSALKDLTMKLSRIFPAITAARIVGHEQVAPGRKTDPGPSFDWSRYLSGLSQDMVEL